MIRIKRSSTAAALLVLALGVSPAAAQTAEAPRLDMLSETEWRRIDQSTDRGLRFLQSQQRADGAIRTDRIGQPGVTGLAVLAFLQQGHLPGQGPYGETIDRAIDFILSCQHRNGLLAVAGRNGPVVWTNMPHDIGVAVSYNHAIAGLALGEAYGMLGSSNERLREPIERALRVTTTMQKWPKSAAKDRGGIRYYHRYPPTDADLSVVGWHLKFMRSAKNAGFDTPDRAIDDAVAYVLRCYTPRFGTFEYEISNDDRRTRAMAGVGILALAHSSRHNRPEALSAADWLSRQSFARYNQQARYGNFVHNSDRYHYGVFYCTLAMYQIGGEHWERFFPPVARTLLANQNRDGSWAPESAHDHRFGRGYTTSLMVIALGAPNQLLPIYQR